MRGIQLCDLVFFLGAVVHAQRHKGTLVPGRRRTGDQEVESPGMSELLNGWEFTSTAHLGLEYTLHMDIRLPHK